MRKILPFGAAMVVAATTLSGSPAQAAQVDVSIINHAFVASTVKLGLGGSVTWTNNEEDMPNMSHTSTSNEGFWDTNTLVPGDTGSASFPSAGTFAYHCKFHPGMHGKVRVRMTVTGSGSSFDLLWFGGDAVPANRTFDVQIKKPGATRWRDYRVNTTQPGAAAKPTKAGTFRVRARTDNLDTKRTSDWSPVKKFVAG
jgi:plastocyanin